MCLGQELLEAERSGLRAAPRPAHLHVLGLEDDAVRALSDAAQDAVLVHACAPAGPAPPRWPHAAA